jgi:hypothetical protein
MSPQFGAMFLTYGAIEYLDGKLNEFSKSPTWSKWSNGMLEMTYPENYGAPYDNY